MRVRVVCGDNDKDAKSAPALAVASHGCAAVDDDSCLLLGGVATSPAEPSSAAVGRLSVSSQASKSLRFARRSGHLPPLSGEPRTAPAGARAAHPDVRRQATA